MCGIAGFIEPSVPSEDRERAVLRMCNAMVHRGPDDYGMATRGPATIGMRRLAIFDPLNGGQPMTTPDGRHTIVFNGAIYNFNVLKAELEAGGWNFRTRCDTEVLLAALAEWGEAALDRLRGMYAFALWDAEEQRLLLARDPFGIKPLYFAHKGERLVFGSEIAAILESGAVDASIDPSAVADYLAWFAVPAPKTIYQGILSLRPGEGLRFCRGKAEVFRGRGFSPAAPASPGAGSRDSFIANLREHLNDTIRAHVLADVQVGAFLSGGLDSAVIAGLMSREARVALKTFTIGFEEDDFSEADEAEQTARHLGSVHHTRILTGDEVARDLDKFLEACDQPTGDGVNTYYVSQTAQQGGIKVALSGLGGDELFGGYPSFRNTPALGKRLPAWRMLPKPLQSLVVGGLRMGTTRSRKLADVLEFANDAHEVGALQRRVFSTNRQLSVLAPAVVEQLGSCPPFHPRLEELRAELGSINLFSLVSAWEMRTYMADVLLRDSDVMSMRNSIELRVPFVDRPLVDWVWSQPERFKYDPKRPKAALVEAAIDVLPSSFAHRRKRGFTLPFPIWMRKDLKPFLDDTFSDKSIGKSGLFASLPIQGMWRAFLRGSDNREWSRIWSLAVLISFANRGRNPRSGL